MVDREEAQRGYNERMSRRYYREMQDEGDLYQPPAPRITVRAILTCVAAAVVIYLLLTAALVLTNG